MLDFIRLCKEFNIKYLEDGHHHSHEGWIQTHCPFCTDGSHGWHLGYSTERGNMNCWRCGSHSLYKYLSAVLGPPFSIKQILNKYQTGTLPEKKKSKPRRRKAKEPPRMAPLSRPHYLYLKRRGFNPLKLIDEWHLTATTGLSGQWAWRIITPIYNIDKMVVGYTGRALGPNTKPEWKTSDNEDMSDDPKKLIYGIEKVQDRVLIVEGPADAWRMGRGAAALLGIDWKVEQAAILKNIAYRFIMFDPEKEAQKRAKELADWLAPFPGDTEIISNLDTDPGELSQKEANKIMNELGF